ncbi:MAG: hypothetical protein KGI28_02350 [Thaumarchaeota archaeon]|nr:hypothetical protein [Nitrososphaerota archaeon]
MKRISPILVLVLFSSFVLGFQTQPVHATAPYHGDLFVSAQNNPYDANDYFSGPRVIEVAIKDADIQSTNQVITEPQVTINGKPLRMAQGVDGYWYAFFADSKQAQIADSTQPRGSGKGLDFGMFCSSTSAITATGIDFSNTKGVAIPSSAPGATDGSSSPNAIISSTCTGQVDGSIKSISGSSVLNHVVRKAPSLNPMTGISGGKLGQIGLNQNAWPIIQLFDFSAIPTMVQIQYNKIGLSGPEEEVDLTFDRIPYNQITVTADHQSYYQNWPVYISINDPSLNIDPTDVDSWTWSTNPANPQLYYQAFTNSGVSDADGTTGMQNLIGNLTSLMFNHDGKLTINPNQQGVRILDFQSNGIQSATPTRGDPFTITTGTLGSSTAPLTFIEKGGTNTGILGNWDGGNKSNVITVNSYIRSQSATIRYNDLNYPINGLGFDINYCSIAAINFVQNTPVNIPLGCAPLQSLAPVIYSITTNPLHGKIVINSNNTATYIPNAFYSGNDQFSYTLNVNGANYGVVFPITLQGSGAANYNCGGSTTTKENYPAQINLGCKGATPIVYSITTNPSHGKIVINPNTGNGTYTPNTFYTGTDQFSYQFNPGLGFGPTVNATINVQSVDFTPTAKTGPDQTVKGNDTVTLDGSESVDPYYNDAQRLWTPADGTLQPISSYLKYSWTQIGGIPVTLSSKTVSNPTFVAPSTSLGMILTFTLTVTDQGSSTSSPVTITIQPSTQPAQNATTPSTNNTVSVPTISNTGITLSTDKSSYSQGNTIIVYGKLSSNIPHQAITIRVLNSFQNPVDIALLAPAPDGSVTTKLLATGPLWQTSGTYTIMAQYNSTIKTLTAFYFNASNVTSSANNVTNTATQSTTVITPTPQDIQNINQAKTSQTIAAEVNVGASQPTTTTIDNTVSVQTTSSTTDSLNVNVSAPSQTAPKVIMFNLPASTNISNLKDLAIKYDGKFIQPTPTMDAILHAKSTDNPSFAIVVTQSGVQVLVLVPHFSTHSITIVNMSKVIPVVPEFPLSILTLMIATFSIILIPRLKQII